AAVASASPSATADDPLSGMLSDLEDALGDIAPPPAASKPAAAVAKTPAARRPEAQPVAASAVPQPVANTASAPMSDEASSMLSYLLHEFNEGEEGPFAGGRWR